jgi:hypothetical protein
MPGLWTYPWNLWEEGLDAACADLADRGVDSLSVATHYHSVRAMQPRFPEALFDERAGGCYFDPDPERFADTPIDPIPNAVGDLDDPLDAVVAAGEGAGLDVNAWTVCFHNSRLGSRNPEHCQEDAFGNSHEHALCPARPAVGRYFVDVVAAAADRGVDAVELESVGWQSVLHSHSTTFGHDKRQVLTTDTEEWLLSQCFCDACRERMDLDADRARRLVRGLLRDSFADPHSDPPPLAALAREYPLLDALFDFRADVVAGLFEDLAAAAGGTALDYYVMDGFGVEPGAGWPAGVTLDAVSAHCNRATALCYVADPAVARERVRTLRRSVDVPVEAGVTLDPDLVPDEASFRALVDAVAGEAEAADVTVYHHGLLTDAQLEWVEAAFA